MAKKKDFRLAQFNPEELGGVNTGMLPEEQIPADAPEVPIEEQVSPNGVPTALTEAANPKSASQQLLEMINSPEFQQKKEEYEQLGKQAIEEQRQGVKQNEAAVSDMEARGPQVNLAPLTSLVDHWAGTKFTDSYKQPDSPQDYQAKLLALKNQIQQQKQGVTKEQLQMIKDQLGGAMSPMAMMKQASTMDYQNRYGKDGPMQDLAEFRTAQGARDKILQKLSTNKDLGARLNAYQTLDNALTNMAAGKIRTKQQLEEFQAAIIQGLGMSRGQSGVNERAERTFKTLDLNATGLMQFLTSKPQDVMKNKELIGHLQDLARQEQTNVRGQFGKKLNALGAGYGRLLEKYPDIKADVRDALGAYAGQFESPSIPDLTKLKKGQQAHVGPAPKPFAPLPGDKKKTNSVDADLDSMSPEELQQWMNTHGQ